MCPGSGGLSGREGRSVGSGASGTARAGSGGYAYAIFFDNVNFDSSAGTITFYGSADCTSARTNTDGAWSDTTTWRNRISSFESKSNCLTKVFYNTYYGGSTNGAYVASRGTLDALNDHVWSAAFT